MSTYNPRRKGRRDGREGKERFMHKSEWNQRMYDEGYLEGLKEAFSHAEEISARGETLEDRVRRLELAVAELRE